MKSRPLLLVSVIAILASAHALPVRYDQRQDGDWNVDARLQNFFVVLAPSNSAQLGSSGISLLDFASKAVPLRLRPTATHQTAGQPEDAVSQSRLPQLLPPKLREDLDQDEQQEVKEAEGRSAAGFLVLPRSALSVNAVPPVFTKDDIARSPLAKLHPEMQVAGGLKPVEEILIARSPVVALKYPAVPMLVAVPVPEVAPEAPAGPPAALLPLQPMQPLRPLSEQPAPDPSSIIQLEETNQVETNEAIEPIPIMPETISAEEPLPQLRPNLPESDPRPQSDLHSDPQPQSVPQPQSDLQSDPQPQSVPQPQSDPQPQSVPQPQSDLQSDLQPQSVPQPQSDPQSSQPQPPRLHLVGTGIEDCGPARQRNQEGVCEDILENVK